MPHLRMLSTQNFENILDLATMAEISIKNIMLYLTIDDKVWSNIRKLYKESQPYFQKKAVPAESASSGLQSNNRWHKIISCWHVLNIATYGEQVKLYLKGTIQLKLFE